MRTDRHVPRRGTLRRIGSGTPHCEDVDVHSDLSNREMEWGTARRESAAPVPIDSTNIPAATTTRRAHGDMGRVHRIHGIGDCVPQQAPTDHAERNADRNCQRRKRSLRATRTRVEPARPHAECSKHTEIVASPTGDRCQRCRRTSRMRRAAKTSMICGTLRTRLMLPNSGRTEGIADDPFESTGDVGHLTPDCGDVGARREMHRQLETALVVDSGRQCRSARSRTTS